MKEEVNYAKLNPDKGDLFYPVRDYLFVAMTTHHKIFNPRGMTY